MHLERVFGIILLKFMRMSFIFIYSSFSGKLLTSWFLDSTNVSSETKHLKIRNWWEGTDYRVWWRKSTFNISCSLFLKKTLSSRGVYYSEKNIDKKEGSHFQEGSSLSKTTSSSKTFLLSVPCLQNRNKTFLIHLWKCLSLLINAYFSFSLFFFLFNFS